MTEEHEVIPYIEPIFRFCRARLDCRQDAEDLASEILCYILDGMQKYEIQSFEAWVWRVAHNRYARWIARKKQENTLPTDDIRVFETPVWDEYFPEDMAERYARVFRALHTLSAEYRNLFVDYYINNLSVGQLSESYGLPETTVKWRLNVGRQKIKERIGSECMEKLYKKIHWNTTTCNGAMDPHRYLHSQIARAICNAAYEKPLTVEEISLCTGIPAMYIEDELPQLEYGDAICKVGGKYATNFILLRLADREKMEKASALLVKTAADWLAELLQGRENLGFILVPYVLRQKIWSVKKDRLHLENGPAPLRQDGGYGWFNVEETDETEQLHRYSTGCNAAPRGDKGYFYEYWSMQYFSEEVYPGLCRMGNGNLSLEDKADFVRNGLMTTDGAYTFPCFTRREFDALVASLSMDTPVLDTLLETWISAVRKAFSGFVPKRLGRQINQWVSVYAFQLVGYVLEELMGRGTLGKPGRKYVLYVDGPFLTI